MYNTSRKILIPAAAFLLAALLAMVPAVRAMDESPAMDEQQVLAWLEQNVPNALPYLEETKLDDPEAYEDEITDLADFIAYLDNLAPTHPELRDALIEAHALEVKTWDLSMQYEEAADKAGKDKIKEQLLPMLSRIFDVRMQEKELEIQEIEAELNELKQMMQVRQKNKDKIIQSHLTDLLEDTETMSWW